MLEYESLKKYKHGRLLGRLWNSEFKSTYPIEKSLFKEKIIDDPNLNKDASFVALYENEPVGFIFIKTWAEDSGFANEEENAYISLIFVKREMRNMGIGSDMLQLSINEIKKHKNIKKLYVGNEITRLFAGVPSEFIHAPVFFMSKGFMQKEGVVDMIRVARNPGTIEPDYKDLKTRIATEEEIDELLKLCVKNGWKREAYSINKYFEQGGSGRRIAIGLIDDKIIAFTRFNDENKLPIKTSRYKRDRKLGCILMEKIDAEYANKGYEEIMNTVTKNYLVQRGCKKICVTAIKNIQFYKKLGYSAFKYYMQFELEL